MSVKTEKKEGGFLRRLVNMEYFGVLSIMILFIIVVVIFSGSKFFTSDNITNLLRSVSVTGIMAVAVTLVMITGNIDLSLGWMIGFTACITGVHSDSFLDALLLSVAAGAACGALNGFLVGVLGLNSFITTLGTMYMFKGIAMLYANGKLLTAAQYSETLKFVGQGAPLGVPMPVWLFLIIALIFAFLLRRSSFGTRVYAVGANPVSAIFSGINSKRIIFMTYLLAGIATAVAGVIFYAKVMSTQAYSGAGLEFDVLTAIVLGGTSVTGGKGTVLGTIFGVIFVGILSNGFILMGLGSNAQYIAQGLILLVAMRADVAKAGGLR